MEQRGYTDIMHIEADNLLYGNLNAIIDIFPEFQGLAATPLNSNKTFMTASVLWIPSLEVMRSSSRIVENTVYKKADNHPKGFGCVS